MVAGPRRVEVVVRHIVASNAVSADADVAHYETGIHFGVNPDYEHPIHLPRGGILSGTAEPPITFPQLLAEAARSFPNDIALAAEKPVPAPESPGVAPALPWIKWAKWTWSQYHEDARKAAKAFMSLGVEHFGSVCIFGFNAPEWMISAYGAMFCGAKYVGIYSTDTPDQVQYKVAHSASAVIVVDGMEEFNNVSSVIDQLPGLNAIVLWGAAAPTATVDRQDGSSCCVMSWFDCLRLGESGGVGVDGQLDRRIAAQKPGHALGIIHTSGTTGPPKAVMVQHDAICAQGAMCKVPESGFLEGFSEGGARLLSYLPLSHIAGGLMDILNPVYFAGKAGKTSTVYFARPYDLKEMTLASRIQFVRPTMFLAVPRVFEKMQARMMAVGASITGVKKSLATWAKGKGLQYARNQ